MTVDMHPKWSLEMVLREQATVRAAQRMAFAEMAAGNERMRGYAEGWAIRLDNLELSRHAKMAAQ